MIGSPSPATVRMDAPAFCQLGSPNLNANTEIRPSEQWTVVTGNCSSLGLG